MIPYGRQDISEEDIAAVTAVLRGDANAPPLERVDVVQPVLWAVMVSLAALWDLPGRPPGGEGAIDKNHVVLYRSLLTRYALDPLDDLDDALYRQGLVQLALGWNAERFLPEVVGFNLGYEQLPLHLLITAYELNEL